MWVRTRILEQIMSLNYKTLFFSNLIKKKKKLGQFHNPRPKIYQGKKFSTIPQIKGAVYASIVKKGNNGKEEREGVRNKECWKNN